MFTKLLLTVFILVFVTSFAFAQCDTYTFNFDGFSSYESDPDLVGSVMDIYGFASYSECPFPMDSDNFEYTIAITGLVVETFDWNQETLIKTIIFSGGTLSIYEDSATGSNFEDRSSLTDGTLFLQSTIDQGWEMVLSDGIGNGVYAGFADGFCDFNSGSDFSEISDSGLSDDDWNLIGMSIRDPSFFNPVPDGYHRFCDILITSPTGYTDNNSVTWGHVKNLFAN
jgi:hypothetical protein